MTFALPPLSSLPPLPPLHAPLDLPYDDASLVDLDRETVRRMGLWKFIRLAWPHVDPQDLVESWHLEEIAAHLEAVSRGDCRRLIINVPPGMSKSTITSVLWPAWDWIGRPNRRWMVATFDQDLAFRDALRCRSLMRTSWYLARWGDRVQIAPAGDSRETMAIYETTAAGRRLSVTVDGKGLGWHADIQLIDDPTNPRDLRQKDFTLAREALDKTWRWWTGTMASRKSDPKSFARVIIMQRLHEEDLVGRILNSPSAKEWTHLCLPMEFEQPGCRTRYGGDRRREPNELLCPERFDASTVIETRIEMGSQVAAAQLQQRPAPSSGNIFLRDWFKVRWLPPERYAQLSDEQKVSGRWVSLPEEEMLLVQSWDCSFKDSSQADPVGGHIWGYFGGKYYLRDRIVDNMGLPATCRCILSWCQKWPKAYTKLIEDKANGPAVEQVLRDTVTGIVMVEPKEIGGSKVGRANATAPIAEAGGLILPDDSVFSWIGEFLESVIAFPFARHDEDVDCMTQAILHLHGHSQARYLEAMRRIAAGDLPAYFLQTRS